MGFTVDIKGNASHLDKTLKGVESSLRSVGNFASSVIKPMAGIGAVGGAAMTAFVLASSKAAADIEDLGIQFEVLTGSVSKSKQLLEQFREEEKKSALSTLDYAEGAKLLLANNVAYEELLPTLRMVGDVSMGNSERFGRVALALGQISSKSKLAAQETNQLAESGFNPLQQMMKMTGQSMADLLKKQEDGQISFKDVAQAMKFATSEGGMFYKAIEKGSVGANAKLNQLSAAVTQLQVAFGTGFNNGLKIALDATNSFLPQMQQKFTDFGFYIGEAIKSGVDGNMEKLQAVGEVIGSAVGAGVPIGFEKLVMGTIEKAIVDFADFDEARGYNQRMKRKSNWMDKAVNATSQKDRDFYIKQANAISSQQNTFRENYNIGDAQQQSSAEKIAEAMQPSMNKLESLNVEAQIQNALKKGTLDTNMSTAVREGVLQAFSKQPQGAKFSN